MPDLTALDRIALLSILPKEGDITTLRIVRELREGLSFTEAEHADLNIQEVDGGGLRWSPEKDTPRTFAFGRKAQKAIEEALEHADRTKTLTLDHISVYEKFFPPEEADAEGAVPEAAG